MTTRFTDEQRLLRERARVLGVQLAYTDNDGNEVVAQTAELEVVVAALEAATDADTSRVVDHVHVAWDGEETDLRLGAGLRGAVQCVLALEDGGERTFVLDAERGPLRLPGGLPYGYHRLDVEGVDTAGCAVAGSGIVISAPRHAHAGRVGERSWGVFCPVYALRSDDDWGIGDLGSARELARLVKGAGGALVGSTPLLATYLGDRGPFEPSPYSPVSRLFWNEALLDVPALREAQTGRARRMIQGGDFDTTWMQLRDEPLIDYRVAYREKRAVLEACAAHLFGRGSARRRDEFEAWRAANPLVDDYARFRAAQERGGDAPAPDHPNVRYHQYAQFAMDTQLAQLAGDPDAAGLYLDLPLGVHPDGFDLWLHRDLFARGISVGAPPDPLAADGQDWGLPPMLPQRSRASHHAYAIACVRHLMRHAAAVRLDHVMGLHRLFWIPSGMGAAHGVYVSYPHEELWAIVCLESHRSGCMVVGEDLGTVPAGVRTAMARHDVRRSYVMMFELDPQGTPAICAPPPRSLACVDTHDTQTWATFWAHELDATARDGIARYLHRTGLLDPDVRGTADDAVAVGVAALELLAGSSAGAVIASLEDLWGETEPQNVPGTGADEQPNWRRRTRRTMQQLSGDRELLDALARIDARRRSPKGTDVASPPTAADQVRHDVSLITDQDLHLFNEGTHNRLHRVLGSHPHTAPDGVAGTCFAVWAPNAERVSVIGDCNGWTPGVTPLAQRGTSGIWEGFVPGIGAGEHYKYHIDSRVDGYSVEKADPFARRSEEPPRTASIVWEGTQHDWRDGEWMALRRERNALSAPMSVYELHPGSWMRDPEEPRRLLSWRELAPKLVEHVTAMGFTHVELLPVMEHPFYGSWGYQTTGYFAPSARHGSPDDLAFLVDELHRAGLGVILDWVPSHFPTDQHGLAFFDGTHLFEHADPRQGFHPDWKTAIFNYSRNEVRSFLLSSAMFWLEEFHIDGLRVDAVASMLYLDYSREEGEWVPNVHGGRENLDAIGFLRRLNEDVYAAFPDVQTIAEESTAWGGVSRPTWTGGIGFGMKWDMGWMHDTLQYFGREAVHRRYHQGELTFRQIYAYTENFMLPLSHDEVVHGKGSLLARMPGDEWQQFANLRLLYSYMWTLPGKKLLFMGCEFAQGAEWSHESSLDWHQAELPQHHGVLRMVSDLNAMYRELPALHQLDCEPAGFSWVDASDAEASTFSFLRHGRDADAAPVLVVLNATPVERTNYRVGVPRGGAWAERFNSDATEYWGSGIGNLGSVEATPVPIHGQPWSVNLTLPPLGCVVLVPEGDA